MMRYSGLAAGIGIASVAAGPVLVLTGALATLYLRMPDPVVVPGGQAAGMLFVLLPSVLVGVIVSFPVNAVGALLMASTGRFQGWARRRAAWALVGGALGTGFALWQDLFETAPAIGFAFAATSAICAWLCSVPLRWSEVAAG
jgi:hypothetical protein